MAGKKGRSGRPPDDTVKSFSQEVTNRVKDAAAKLSKEFGMPIEEAMLRMCYDQSVQDSVRSGVFKTYMECFVEKKSSKDIKVTEPLGPSIGLPPKKSGK